MRNTPKQMNNNQSTSAPPKQLTHQQKAQVRKLQERGFGAKDIVGATGYPQRAVTDYLRSQRRAKHRVVDGDPLREAAREMLAEMPADYPGDRAHYRRCIIANFGAEACAPIIPLKGD